VEFEVDLEVLLALNNFGNQCPISPGDRILIPAPGQQLPTETPIPADMPRGTKIEYQIKTGETLAIIAVKFNSTVEEILKETNIYYRATNCRWWKIKTRSGRSNHHRTRQHRDTLPRRLDRPALWLPPLPHNRNSLICPFSNGQEIPFSNRRRDFCWR
jgi:hypothetical protein